jgi:hypothetical protein
MDGLAFSFDHASLESQNGDQRKSNDNTYWSKNCPHVFLPPLMNFAAFKWSLVVGFTVSIAPSHFGQGRP